MAELTDRFAGRLQFGTAGLRGAVGGRAEPDEPGGGQGGDRGAGRAGCASTEPGGGRVRGGASAATPGTGRREFADEAAAVLTGAGHRAFTCCRGRSPTPLLAFAIRHLSAGGRAS